MAQFTVRVELHGALPSDYDRLHELMNAYLFRRFVAGVDAAGGSGKWAMPTGEYDYTAENTATDVRVLVKTLADSIKPGAWVFVTQVADRSWITAKLQG
jgi:hypothetical protein